MADSKLLGLFLHTLLLTGLSNGERQAILDKEGKYSISWEVDLLNKTIEVEATVETTGFVGFGLNTIGGMSGADIVIGGVDSSSGEPYFSDRHATENAFPPEDDQQDWTLLYATENSTHTSLRFSRLLDSCDSQDVAVKESTLKIIWSYGESDTLSYHGTNRGAYAINLLDPPTPPIDLDQFPRFETLMDFVMPAEDTVYWCTTHKAPSFAARNHVVGFRPKIKTEDALRHSHHFNFYKCKAPEGRDPVEFFTPYVNSGGDNCLVPPFDNVPVAYCTKFVYLWSVGGREFVFPEHLGFPVGEGQDEFFMLEVHLDNPTRREGVRIVTGLETFYSPELRPTDAGVIMIGQDVGLYQTIPPGAEDFLTIGHCSSACTTAHFPPEGISMFNIMLHAHKSGRKLKLRHFRGNTELPWIANDETYDFDYQDNRNMDELRILPGDQLTLECTYDVTWMEPPNAVIGGWSTRDEMCEAFFYYYPRIPLETCVSRFPETKLFENFGIQNFTSVPELLTDVLVTSPPSLANLTYSQVVSQTEWTTESRDAFERMTRFDSHLDICMDEAPTFPGKAGIFKRYFVPSRQEWPPVSYPKVDEEYQPIDSCATTG